MTIFILKTENNPGMDIIPLLEKTRKAASWLTLCSAEQISALLNDLADTAEQSVSCILEENRKDLEKMDPADPRYDRLQLTSGRIEAIAAGIRQVAALPSPLGETLSDYLRADGLHIKRVTVPFGVIGIIYEARPNVTFDVFSLCLKSGNGCVLKGGSDAHHSNNAILGVIRGVLERHAFPVEVVTLLPAGREETRQMLEARGYIDLIIPRGSQGLIDYVREHATVPVIETGAGICHTYFDLEGDAASGAAIIFNAKTRRPSVCNALDCLIIHRDRLGELPQLTALLAGKEVILYADVPAFQALQGHYPSSLLQKATPDSWGTEYLSLRMAIKTVDNLGEALDHIGRYSSRHSEAILTGNQVTAGRFCQKVDAAVVYVNASTAFTDGEQFGLGAEIGISTQKLHARGPMALRELTTYKWMVTGQGHTRP